MRSLVSQEPAYERCFDVLVIGAGLAGLFTAAVLSRVDLRVAVIARGIGSIVVSSGCVDVLKRTPQGELVYDLQSTLSAFKNSWPEHPYAKVGWEIVEKAEEYLLNLLASIGLNYYRPYGASNTQAVTPLGTLKFTHLLPKAMASRDILRNKSIIILSIAGFTNFTASLVQSNLSGLIPESRISWGLIRLPEKHSYSRDFSVRASFLAEWLEREENREEFIRKIKEAVPKGIAPQVILLPAIMGIKRHYEIWKAVRDSLGVEVLEVPTLPPSVPGLRFFHALKSFLEGRKIHLNFNCQAVRAKVVGQQAQYLDATSEGKMIRYRAKYYVLATGGIINGGLIMQHDRGIYEPLFGSPVTDHWDTNLGMFPFKVGVVVDPEMHVEGLQNVFACGRILGGYNPYFEGCGHGLALATAWKASKAIEREAGI